MDGCFSEISGCFGVLLLAVAGAVALLATGHWFVLLLIVICAVGIFSLLKKMLD